jgi:hypothetical protein
VHPMDQSKALLIRCDLVPQRLLNTAPERHSSSHDETYFRLWTNVRTIGIKPQYDPMCFVFNSCPSGQEPEPSPGCRRSGAKLQSFLLTLKRLGTNYVSRAMLFQQPL